MTTPFTDHLVAGATWLLLAGAAWLGLLVAAAAVEHLGRGRLPALAAVGCPTAWRPALLWALGAALALGTPGSASAQPSDLPPPVPVRPVDAPTPPRERVVVVAPGDSLWALAQTWSPAAGPAAVQRLVVRAHRLNRAVIGPDPDLLQPGQRLRVPRTHPTTERTLP